VQFIGGPQRQNIDASDCGNEKKLFVLTFLGPVERLVVCPYMTYHSLFTVVGVGLNFDKFISFYIAWFSGIRTSAAAALMSGRLVLMLAIPAAFVSTLF
jgi:hypothetical protein